MNKYTKKLGVYTAFALVAVILSACGGGDSDPVANTDVPPVADAGPTNPTIPPTGNTSTGSLEPKEVVAEIEDNEPVKEELAEIKPDENEIAEEKGSDERPVQLAQNDDRYHPRYGRVPPGAYGRPESLKPVFKGFDVEETVSLDIGKPPFEFNTCVFGMRIEGLQPAEFSKILEGNDYNKWWLVASRIGINRLTPEKPVYFYWATKVAENEFGIVPANFSTEKLNVSDPEDIKIDTGYAQLPYVWIDQLIASSPYPQRPEECRKG